MSNISQLDLDVRLQLSGQKYSELINKYFSLLKIGKKDYNLRFKLILLHSYIELLYTFQIERCGNSGYNNCIDEDDALSIFDKISKLTGICFQPLGYKYQGDTPQDGVGAMEIGCDFIVS